MAVIELIKKLTSRETLLHSWHSVASKGSAAGIDRVTVAEFADSLEQNIATLCNEIGSGAYKPLPVVRIRPSFLGSSDRALVVPAVRDRCDFGAPAP